MIVNHEKYLFINYCESMTGLNIGLLSNDSLIDLLNQYCNPDHWLRYSNTFYHLKKFGKLYKM